MFWLQEASLLKQTKSLLLQYLFFQSCCSKPFPPKGMKQLPQDSQTEDQLWAHLLVMGYSDVGHRRTLEEICEDWRKVLVSRLKITTSIYKWVHLQKCWYHKAKQALLQQAQELAEIAVGILHPTHASTVTLKAGLHFLLKAEAQLPSKQCSTAFPMFRSVLFKWRSHFLRA